MSARGNQEGKRPGPPRGSALGAEQSDRDPDAIRRRKRAEDQRQLAIAHDPERAHYCQNCYGEAACAGDLKAAGAMPISSTMATRQLSGGSVTARDCDARRPR